MLPSSVVSEKRRMLSRNNPDANLRRDTLKRNYMAARRRALQKVVAADGGWSLGADIFKIDLFAVASRLRLLPPAVLGEKITWGEVMTDQS